MREVICNCGRLHHVEDSPVGYHFRCQECGRIIEVQSMGEAEDDLDMETSSGEPFIQRRRSALGPVMFLIAFLVVMSMALSSTRTYWWPILVSAPYGRPRTGAQLVYAIHEGGRGRLEIQNVSSYDALVQMVVDGELKRAIYVRSREGLLLQDLPAGDYLVQFTMGLGWNSQEHHFQRYAWYGEFIEPLNYTPKDITHVHYELRLDNQPARSPKVRTLSPEEFFAPPHHRLPGTIEL